MTYLWTPDDADHFVTFCSALGIIDHTVPLHVSANESDNDPSAWDRNGDASGLWQLVPSSARGLGYRASDPKLVAFRAMTVADQLTWWIRYFAPHRGQLGTVAGFYVACFLPALLHLADQPQAVLCAAAGPLAWAYEDNKSFDVHGRGSIIVQDLVDAANRQYGPRAQSIAALVARHVDTQPEMVIPEMPASDATLPGNTNGDGIPDDVA